MTWLFHRGLFVAGEGHVEAAGLMGLVAEIFHRFVVQQAVDRLGLRVGVALVHAAADGDAVVAEEQGEGEVEADGERGDGGELPVEDLPDDGGDHHHFEQSGDDVEDGEAEHGLHAVGAALDGAGQAAGLAVEMEAEREAVQVLEGFERHEAGAALLDGGEDGVAEFAEAGGGDAEQAVAEDEGGGDEDERGRRAGGVFGREGVDGAAVDQGDEDGGDLGGDEEGDGEGDADMRSGVAGGPEIGQQGPDGLQAGPFGPGLGGVGVRGDASHWRVMWVGRGGMQRRAGAGLELDAGGGTAGDAATSTLLLLYRNEMAVRFCGRVLVLFRIGTGGGVARRFWRFTVAGRWGAGAGMQGRAGAAWRCGRRVRMPGGAWSGGVSAGSGGRARGRCGEDAGRGGCGRAGGAGVGAMGWAGYDGRGALGVGWAGPWNQAWRR